MHRRDVLGAVSTVAVAGCLTDGRGVPGWLVRPSRCDDAPVALLEMCDTAEPPRAETVTVAYGDLRRDSRAIVKFAFEHDAAATCDEREGESAFAGLKADIDAAGLGEYLSENRGNPNKVYVEKGTFHYPIRRLCHVDVTVIG